MKTEFERNKKNTQLLLYKNLVQSMPTVAKQHRTKQLFKHVHNYKHI